MKCFQRDREHGEALGGESICRSEIQHSLVFPVQTGGYGLRAVLGRSL